MSGVLQSIRSIFSLRYTSRSKGSDNSQPIYLRRTFEVDVENRGYDKLANTD
jgi:hypothetical protein